MSEMKLLLPLALGLCTCAGVHAGYAAAGPSPGTPLCRLYHDCGEHVTPRRRSHYGQERERTRAGGRDRRGLGFDVGSDRTGSHNGGLGWDVDRGGDPSGGHDGDHGSHGM